VGKKLLMKRTIESIIAIFGLLFGTELLGADWPQFRYDAGRTAACPEELSEQLYLQWIREFAAPRPTFPREVRLLFDASYEPVVMGGTIFVPSMVTDSVTALDTATGAKKWRYYAEGPVRFAPAVWRNKVYFVSDDGCLYCVAATDGKLNWKFRGLPVSREDRKLMGDGRLISVFPARGGPVLADGIIYFAAGIWSDEGVFVHALNAQTGQVVWSNTDGDRIDWANPDHGVAAPAGISPLGHLAIVNGTLIVPCGAQLPALIDIKTGKLHTYTMGFGGKYRMPKGSVFVSGSGKYLLHAGDLYDLGQVGIETSLSKLDEEFDKRKRATKGALQQWEAWLNSSGGIYNNQRMIHLGALPRIQVERTNEDELGDFRKPVLTTDAMYCQQDGIVAYDLTRPKLFKRGESGFPNAKKERYPDSSSVVFPELWKIPSRSEVYIKAGGRLYCGRPGMVEMVNIRNNGETPRIGWRTEVQGTPHCMLAANGKLFVVTLEGCIYAFGPNKPAQPVVHKAPPPAPLEDQWTEKVNDVINVAGITDGYALILGLSDARLAEELVRQSDCDVIAIQADASKAAALRDRFQQSGLYGTRISVLVGDPFSYRFPPYLASLIIPGSPDESARANNAAFFKAAFRCLRPYGGTLCLDVSAGAQQSMQRLVSSGEFNGGFFRKKGLFTMLVREGALVGAADWSHAGANAANTGAAQDRVVKPPLKRLWFDGSSRWQRKPQIAEVRVAGGRVLVKSDPAAPNYWKRWYQHETNEQHTIDAYDAYTGRHLWHVVSQSGYREFIALEDTLYMNDGDSCLIFNAETGKSCGKINLPRNEDGRWSSIRISGNILIAKSNKLIIAINRETGEMLWDHQCENAIESIAVGGDKVFCTDVVNRRRNAVEPNDPGGSATALDVRSGELLWNINTTGELLYSESLDTLVIGRDVYKGKNSQLLWKGPWADQAGALGGAAWESDVGGRRYKLLFIAGDKLVSYEVQDSPKHAVVNIFDLLTGDKIGNEFKWWLRGCTVLRAGSNLLTTRYLGNAAYFDLTDKQMTLISNVRASCSNNLYAADGVLSMPNLIGGCNCNYVPVSQGFAPSSVFE